MENSTQCAICGNCEVTKRKMNALQRGVEFRTYNSKLMGENIPRKEEYENMREFHQAMKSWWKLNRKKSHRKSLELKKNNVISIYYCNMKKKEVDPEDSCEYFQPKFD